MAGNDFFRGVSVLAGGTALGQLIAVLGAPILTRLYSPEDFGVFGVYGAVFGLIVVVASLRYELAIPLPRSDAAAANVAVLAFACVGLVTAVTVAAVAFAGGAFAAWTKTTGHAGFLWLVPAGVLLTGSYVVASYWAVRRRAFGRIARTKLQQAIGGVGTQIGLGFTPAGPFGLIVGQMVGQSAGLAVLAADAIRKDGTLYRYVSGARMRVLAHRYRRFPIYSTLEGLTNAGAAQLPLLLLAVFFLPAEVGLFLLALRVLEMPLSVVGSAVGQVFFSHASAARHEGTVDLVTLKVFRGMLVYGTMPLITFAFFAPEVFALVFGEPWRQAGLYAQWMAPWLVMQLVFSPISLLTAVQERQRGAFIAQTLFLVVRTGALVWGASLGTPMTAIIAYSIAGVAAYLAYGAWLMRIAGVSPWSWVRPLIIYLVLFSGVATGIRTIFDTWIE